MATDATGTPSTVFSIPKYNVNVDSPSGLGLNGIVDFIDNLLATRTFTGPTCRVKRSVATPLTTSVEAVIPFDTESYDTDTMHDNVTNNTRITIKTPGKYRLTAHVDYAFSGVGVRYIAIRKNGTTDLVYATAVPLSGSSGTDLVATTEGSFVLNDYVEVYAFQSSGGPLNITASNDYSPVFIATKVT